MTILVTIMFALVLLLTILLVACNASAAFYLLLAYIPINTLLPEGLPYRESQALLRFAAFAGTIVFCISRRYPLRKVLLGDTLSRLLLIWLGAIFLSFIVSGHYSAWAERTIIRMASYIALYFAFRVWLRNRDQFTRASRVISLIILLSSLFAIVQVIYGGFTPLFDVLHNSPPFADWQGRPPSFLNSGSNAFGGFMGLLIPFEIASLTLSSTYAAARFFHWIVLALGLVAVILSGSRGATLSVAVSCALAAFLFVRQKRLRIVAIFGLIILLPVFTVVAAILSPRLTQIDQQESVGARYLIWAEAWGMFVEHPVTGIGMGNFRETYAPEEIQEDPGKVDVHNLYLQFLTETGVVGFAAFLVLVSYILRRNFRNLRVFPRDSIGYSSSYAAMGAMLSVLIHGMVDFLFIGSTEFGAAFAIVLAISAAADQQEWAKEALHPKGIHQSASIDGTIALERSTI